MAKESVFNSGQGLGVSSSLGPTQPPTDTRDYSPEVKWLENEANCSTPSNVESKNVWRYTSTLPYKLMAWGSTKHRDDSTYTSLFVREKSRESANRKLP
jgi:hypothetical protein